MTNLLDPYQGDWDGHTASHLLRRTFMGPTFAEVVKATDDGLFLTVDNLLQVQPSPDPPLLHRPETEPVVPVGTTWVDKPHPTSGGAYRGQSFKAWFYEWLTHSPYSIQSQMVFFWLNHFGMERVSDHRAMYKYIEILQSNGLGNIKTMIERITIEPAMLDFLDGHHSSERFTNENYARELLELFTIQKGDQIGDSDYTNYTEEDVVTISRVLTGWRNLDYAFADNDTPIDSYFDPDRHDYGEKVLSHRFDNITIPSTGADEYVRVIDIIFDKRETARAFCRKIYRFFVHSDLSPTIESEIIEPLTDILIDANYEIIPVLRSLLTSTHFYSENVVGAKVKNPAEFVVGIIRSFEDFDHIEFESLQSRYGSSVRHADFCAQMEMEFNVIPFVAGWSAYRQAPAYYRQWATPSSLQFRRETVMTIVSPYYHSHNFRTPINWRGFLAGLSDPENVNAVVNDSALIFLSHPLDDAQFDNLKDMLIPAGSQDHIWMLEYLEYVNNPDDAALASSFQRRMYDFFRAMFGMLEFQLH